MKEANYILGLFFCTENNLIFEEIKVPGTLSKSALDGIRTLSLRYLGPIFLTKALKETSSWTIERIESSISINEAHGNVKDFLQSFFLLNSTIQFQGKITNLFAFIGSPYTEDIKIIYDKMDKLIHPSILQGKVVKEAIMGEDFRLENFLQAELKRGLSLIEYSLGSSRKIYWEAPIEYYCVGVIKRKIAEDKKESGLFTCDPEDVNRIEILKSIPSFYVISILPNYYEQRIKETLFLFDVSGLSPNIRLIKLSKEDKIVIYLEEYLIDDNVKESYGVILVNKVNLSSEPNKMIHYRQKLRQIIDKKKSFEQTVAEINPMINPFVNWGTLEKDPLHDIQNTLDSVK